MNLCCPEKSDFKKISSIDLLMLRDKELLLYGCMLDGKPSDKEVRLMKRLIKKDYEIGFVITHEKQTFYTIKKH